MRLQTVPRENGRAWVSWIPVATEFQRQVSASESFSILPPAAVSYLCFDLSDACRNADGSERNREQ